MEERVHEPKISDHIENLRATCEDRGWSCHIMSCHTNPERQGFFGQLSSTLSVLSKLSTLLSSHLKCAIANIQVAPVKASTMFLSKGR